MFINSDSVFFDFSKNIENMWLSCMGCTVCRIGNPFWFADGFTGVFPVLLLNSEINIGVRIGFPAFTFQDPARLTATTCITTAGTASPNVPFDTAGILPDNPIYRDAAGHVISRGKGSIRHPALTW